MKKINIKNPITIFNKVEEINGVPIEISSLDSTLLVAENEGKVYKCDGKLYKVVGDKERGILVDLTGVKIVWNDSIVLPSSYTPYSINFTSDVANENYVKIQLYSDQMQYVYPTGSSAISIIAYITKWTNVKLQTIYVTDGDDVTNPNLISYVLQNAKVEGGTYEYTSFIFQEILSPSGTLDITANGEVDVKTYEKVNVNVEGEEYDGTIEVEGEGVPTEYIDYYDGSVVIE